MYTKISSNDLCHFSELIDTEIHVSHFAPADGHHLIVATFTLCKHDSKLILCGTDIVISFVTEGNDDAANNVTDSKRFRDFDLVDLCRANVLLPNQCLKRLGEDVCAGRSECENVEGCLAWICARYAA